MLYRAIKPIDGFFPHFGTIQVGEVVEVRVSAGEYKYSIIKNDKTFISLDKKGLDRCLEPLNWKLGKLLYAN